MFNTDIFNYYIIKYYLAMTSKISRNNNIRHIFLTGMFLTSFLIGLDISQIEFLRQVTTVIPYHVVKIIAAN